MQVKLISYWPSLSWHQHIDCFQFFSLPCNLSFVLSSYQGLHPLRLKMQELLLNPSFGNFILEGIKHTSTKHQWNINVFPSHPTWCPGFLYLKIQWCLSGSLLKFCLAYTDRMYFYLHTFFFFLKKTKCPFTFNVFTNKVCLKGLKGVISAIILPWAIIS